MNALRRIAVWRKLVWALLVLSLVPLFIISFYNHSSADDYAYGIITRHAWENSHNVLLLLQAAGQQVAKTYLTWQGTYAAVALFALQPAVFGEGCYVVVTWILVTVFVLSNFFFFRVLFGRIGGRNDIGDILFGITTILSMQTLPHALQSFFWWNGASYYTLFYSLMLIQTAIFAEVLFRGSWKRRQLITALLLGMIISGGNFVSALVNMEITVFLVLICIWKRRKALAGTLAVAAATLAGLLISVLAPGNQFRMAEEATESPLPAIGQSFMMAYRYMHEWTTPLLILAMLRALPFLWRFHRDNYQKEYDISLLFLVIVLFAVFASSFTPTIYATEQEGPRRVQNIRYFLWILMCIMAESVAVGKVQKLLVRSASKESILDQIERAFSRGLVSFFAGILVCILLCVSDDILPKENRNTLTSVSAARSLMIGEAQKFDAEMDERIRLLNSDAQHVTLQPPEDRPEVLYYFDITNNINDWSNVAMADFYDKTDVLLNTQDSTAKRD